MKVNNEKYFEKIVKKEFSKPELLDELNMKISE